MGYVEEEDDDEEEEDVDNDNKLIVFKLILKAMKRSNGRYTVLTLTVNSWYYGDCSAVPYV